MLSLYFLVSMPSFPFSVCFPSLLICFMIYPSLARMLGLQMRKNLRESGKAFLKCHLRSENKERSPRTRNWKNRQEEECVKHPKTERNRAQTKRSM